MPLLEEGRVVPDRWEHAGDETQLPAGRNFIVCLDRLRRDKDFLFTREAPLGVELQPGTKPEEVAEFLPHLDLVAIEFPKFRDGRGFTLARTLSSTRLKPVSHSFRSTPARSSLRTASGETPSSRVRFSKSSLFRSTIPQP